MIKAVVFDLDGTITRPFLNFKQIRLEIGAPQGRLSLLDQIEAMPAAEKRRALETLERHEETAAANAELNIGVTELLGYVSAHGLQSAILTRNSAKSTRFVLEKLNLTFDRVITRDSGLPLKPDPAGLFALAREWGIKTSEMLMAGDYLYDVICGRAAGTITCLVTNGQEIAESGGPDFMVQSPAELMGVLKEIGHHSKRAIAPGLKEARP